MVYRQAFPQFVWKSGLEIRGDPQLPGGCRQFRGVMSLARRQQVDEGNSGVPVPGCVANRRWVEIEEADEHFADDTRADRAEAAATAPNVSLAQDVVPEWRFVAPACLRGSDFVTSQRCFAEPTGDRFA